MPSSFGEKSVDSDTANDCETKVEPSDLEKMLDISERIFHLRNVMRGRRQERRDGQFVQLSLPLPAATIINYIGRPQHFLAPRRIKAITGRASTASICRGYQCPSYQRQAKHLEVCWFYHRIRDSYNGYRLRH